MGFGGGPGTSDTDNNFMSSSGGHIPPKLDIKMGEIPGRVLLYVKSGMGNWEGSISLKQAAAQSLPSWLEICPLVDAAKFFCILQQ